MNNWIFLTILCAILIAFFEASKKKALKTSSIYEVLAKFSLIAFLIVLFTTNDAFKIDYTYLPIIFMKSSIIVMAWILGVKALEKMPISLYGMINISRIIFSVLLSCLILGEKITIITLIGMSIIICGLVLVNKRTNKKEKKKTSFIVIIILLISCFLNAVSSVIDKIVLVHVSSSQLQFWFLLFLTIYYWIIFIIKKEKITIKKNYWIPLAAIFLVLSDRFLFLAKENVNSSIIIITVLKQLSVIATIILGKLLFKEKHIIIKLLYSLLIILGVIIMII